MSQQAARTIPVTMGNTARALNVPLAEPSALPSAAPKRARTPLSLVVSSPRRTRSQLVVILFMVVLAALTVVLVMSISVSKGQYELVGLKNQQTDLFKANQALEQEIAAKQAPQELVARAVALGMVPAGTTGQIDVRTQKVSGAPQPAAADTKGLVVIPPALVDKPKPAPAAEAPQPVQRPLSPAAQAEADAKSEPEAPAAAAPAPAVDKGPELNGGSIPAPAEKDS